MKRVKQLASIFSIVFLICHLTSDGAKPGVVRAEINHVRQQPDEVSTTYNVALGDTLEVLALKFDATSDQLAHLNGIVNPKMLFAGQNLMIPPTEDYTNRDNKIVSSNGSIISEAIHYGDSLAVLSTINSRRNPLLTTSGQAIAFSTVGESSGQDSDEWLVASMHPVPLEQGHSGGIHITARDATTVSIVFNERTIQLVHDADGFVGIIGVDRWASPGIFPILIQLEKVDGSRVVVERRILVEAGIFQSEDIRLTSEVALVLDNDQTVAEESAYIAQVMSGYTPEIYWHNLFQLPAAGVLTSTYGTSRLYNDLSRVNLFHSGNDLAAQTGTPIIAPADGVVVEIGELAIRGLITVIDHGAGVYTGYWHQSAIMVHEGDVVKAGQQIGAIGNTGLSTASHLHWEMWVGGVQVDSMQWVRESFP